ncbi:MAG: hypothetical protein EZS28_037801 [Streblomastix strix]|uniref:Uncharacterized protein n=1 Tax=Streblomastix strix TaxID=222440 RepID=A0A5J4U9T8_9EUKA|nr:MAG: hypothetical protein EZS28_037801 [Streblomastix strix]
MESRYQRLLKRHKKNEAKKVWMLIQNENRIQTLQRAKKQSELKITSALQYQAANKSVLMNQHVTRTLIIKYLIKYQLYYNHKKVVTVVQIVFIPCVILVDSVPVEESVVIIVMQSIKVSVVEIAIRMVIILVSYVTTTIMDQVEVGLDPDFGIGIGAGRDTGIY